MKHIVDLCRPSGTDLFPGPIKVALCFPTALATARKQTDALQDIAADLRKTHPVLFTVLGSADPIVAGPHAPLWMAAMAEHAASNICSRTIRVLIGVIQGDWAQSRREKGLTPPQPADIDVTLYAMQEHWLVSGAYKKRLREEEKYKNPNHKK